MNKKDWEAETMDEYSLEGVGLYTSAVERLEGRKIDWGKHPNPDVEKFFKKTYLPCGFILWLWKDVPILVGTACYFDTNQPKTASWMFKELYHAN